MFGATVSSGYPGVSLSLEQGDLVAKPPADPLSGIYSHSHTDSDDSPRSDGAMVSQTSSSNKTYVILVFFTTNNANYTPKHIVLNAFCRNR